MEILERIFYFLQDLARAFTPNWEAIAMFWPELLTFLVIFLVPSFICIYFGVKDEEPQRPKNPQGRVSRSYRTDSRNRGLQHKLIEMLRGDTALAKRLLRQQRQINPGRSDNWYLEKVIRDLERDRRC